MVAAFPVIIIILRVFKYFLVFLFGGLLIYLFAIPFWNRWIKYPRIERDLAAYRSLYQPTEQIFPLNWYQGALHAHTYWSHDSRGILDEILPAAKEAKIDFVFFSDHKRNALDTFPRSIQGMYDGVLFEPGTESNLLMVTPLRDTVIDWNLPQDSLIADITRNGGLVLYLHTERDHDWGNPHYQGMEIYNIHTDLLDEKGILPFLMNNIVNGSKYKHWAYREIFDEQTGILSLWDSLNQHRKIVGYGAPDVHNNQSIRAKYLDEDLVEWVGPNAKTLKIAAPNWFDRLLLGKAEPGEWAFKWELDTYFHSFKYVQTHLFATELTRESLVEAFLAGHAIISFENLLEAKGFQFFGTSENGELAGIVGDSLALDKVQKLHVLSPYPVDIELFRNGTKIDAASETYRYAYPIERTGNYRIEARIEINGESVPWLFTNPIYVY